MPDPQQRKLSQWFESDEKVLLERIVGSRIAALTSDLANTVMNRGGEYLSDDSLTNGQKSILRECSRMAVFLEVLQQLDTEQTNATQKNEQPFKAVSHIDIA